MRHALTLDNVVAARDGFEALIASHYVLAVLAYIAGYAAIVAFSLPSAGLLTVAGGLFFGVVTGGLAAVIAATLGASVLFGVTRFAAGERSASALGAQAARFQAGFRRDALSYMLFLRLVPLFPFCAVNVLPALLGVPFVTFFIGTLFGILPATMAISTVGAGLDEAIAAAKAQQALCLGVKSALQCPLSIELGALVTPQLKIAFASLSLLALVPIAVKYWRRRHGR